jgi:hypothetical protein
VSIRPQGANLLPAANRSPVGDYRRVRAASLSLAGAQPAAMPAGGDQLNLSTIFANQPLPRFLAPAVPVAAPQKGLVGRFIDWIKSLFAPVPAAQPPVAPPAPPPFTPPITPPFTPPITPPLTPPITPPLTPPVAPPLTPPVAPPLTTPVTPPVAPPAPNGVTPGVQVYFTNAYAGAVNGMTNAQARAANEASTRADPNNPDKKLVALIDSVQPGGTLDGAFFSIGVDNVTEALVRAAQRGVRVRLVTETEYYFQSDNITKRPMIQKLEAAGINLLHDQRSGLMHDKFLVVDGGKVWTGSYNITEGGTYHENNNAMQIDSPELAQIYTHEFDKMYVHGNFGVDTPTNGNPLDDHPVLRTVRLGNATVDAHFSPFMAAQRGAKGAILDEIAKAQKSIQFLAFSFHDDDIGAAMLAKAGQGVKVEGVFEKSQAASRTSEYKVMNPQEAALNGNLDVRIDTNPALMHHKVIIVDDSTLIMGSFNFSASAQEKNDENMLVFRNAPDLVAQYRAEFGRVQAVAVE